MNEPIFRRRKRQPTWQCRVGWHRWYVQMSGARGAFEWKILRCERCFKRRDD